MKLNTGLTAFTLISSFCAGAKVGDSVTTGRRKKVHLRGKATISYYTNPANRISAVSANKKDASVGVEAESNQSNQPSSYSHSSHQDKDKGVPSPSKSSIKTGYFENLPSSEETYGKFVGKYAVCKNMYTVAEGDVNDITLSSKQLGSSPLEGSKASYIEITNVNQTGGTTPFSFHAERRWGTATGLHDNISYVGTASTAHNREVIQFYSYLNAEESQGGFLDESDTMTCIKTGYSDITMVCDIVTKKQVDEAGIGTVLTEVWYLTGPVNPEDENDPCSSIRGVDRPLSSTIPDSSPTLLNLDADNDNDNDDDWWCSPPVIC